MRELASKNGKDSRMKLNKIHDDIELLVNIEHVQVTYILNIYMSEFAIQNN